MKNLAALQDDSDESKFLTSHKEVASTHIENDKNDREAIKSKLDLCIHLQKPDDHPQSSQCGIQYSCIREVNIYQAIRIWSQLVG